MADSTKSLATRFRLVKDAVGRIGGDKRRMRVVMSHLDDVSHKVPMVGGAAGATLDRIEALLTSAPRVEVTDAVKLRAAQRAIDKRAPFHRERNSMADALLIEFYAECLQAKGGPGTRFAFVTHNKHGA